MESMPWSINDALPKAQTAAEPMYGPCGFIAPDNTQRILYIDAAGHIQQLRYGGGWSAQDLTVDFNVPSGTGWPSPASSMLTYEELASTDSGYVAYRSKDKDTLIWLRSQPGGPGYTSQEILANLAAPVDPLPVPTGVRPSAFVWPIQETSHVVYLGNGGTLHEVFATVNNPWTHNSPNTYIHGLPAAMGEPVGLSMSATVNGIFESTKHMFYADHGGHIQHLMGGNNDGWTLTNTNLDAKVGAPPAEGAAGLLSAYGYNPTGGNPALMCLVYLDAAGHVIQLVWDAQEGGGFQYDQNWSWNNLSDAGGPECRDAPACYVWQIEGNQHVAYWGTDKLIHELYTDSFDIAQDWNYQPMFNQGFALPPAGGGPGAYAWQGTVPDQQSEHIVFVGEDHKIYELYYGAG